MANTTVSTVTITKENATVLIDSIRDNLKVVNKGYLSIAPDLQKLYDTKAFEVLGYKNFDDLCDNMFDMSHGTTVGIRKVFKLYGVKRGSEYMIPDKYLAYGYTKLLWFATDAEKFKNANINPINVFEPTMSLAAMKNALTLTLASKAKEQDENAIETDGSIIDNQPSEDSTEDTSIADNADENTFNDWVSNPNGYVDYILRDMESLLEITKDTVKPEKLTLLEGAIDFMKQYKKAIK